MLGTWFDWRARGDDAHDPVKTLYVREVRPALDRHGDPLAAVLNRELHSERDTSARRFVHADGKVRRYPAATYEATAANPRGSCGPHSHSRKLWRVDGPLTDEQWCQLVGSHFRRNKLVGEHFGEAFPRLAVLTVAEGSGLQYLRHLNVAMGASPAVDTTRRCSTPTARRALVLGRGGRRRSGRRSTAPGRVAIGPARRAGRRGRRRAE